MTNLDSDTEMLRKVAEQLGEHFDAVHVFATRHEGDDKGAVFVHHGVGNYFARYGMMREWVNKMESGEGEN